MPWGFPFPVRSVVVDTLAAGPRFPAAPNERMLVAPPETQRRCASAGLAWGENAMKIVVAGATGKLGRLVIDGLLQNVPASQMVAAVRHPEKAVDLAARGVDVRHVDASRPETLKAAFSGTQKALLISSAEENALAWHQAVLEAAKKAHIRLLVYTSMLHAEESHLRAAAVHRATERLLRASGLTHVILRNGLYLENFTEQAVLALENGAVIGNASEGRVAGASRADYAAAAVAVLTGTGHENKIYELVGDKPFGMADLADEISRIAGKQVGYEDLTPEDHGVLLVAAGLPAERAEMLVDVHLAISRGEMTARAEDLRRLIGRPTTTLAGALAAALPQAPGSVPA